MVASGRVEVPENAARRGSGIDVAAVLGQVPLQSCERGELALDAAWHAVSMPSGSSKLGAVASEKRSVAKGTVPSATAEDSL